MTGATSRLGGRRIVLVAVFIAAVFLALSVRRTAMDALLINRSVPSDTAYIDLFTGPQSVIAINIDPENYTTEVIDLTPPPPPPPPPPPDTDTTRVRPEREEPATKPDLDLDDILNQTSAPKTSPNPTAVGAVPPRPIEITWPETRQLKECIGRSVSVKIRVSEKGTVKEAHVVPSDVLQACKDAALAAARHIRFDPGRQGGVAVEMWTEVRIDFQKRD